MCASARYLGIRLLAEELWGGPPRGPHYLVSMRLYAIGPGLCIFNNSRDSKRIYLPSLPRPSILFNVLYFVPSLFNEDKSAILVD